MTKKLPLGGKGGRLFNLRKRGGFPGGEKKKREGGRNDSFYLKDKKRGKGLGGRIRILPCLKGGKKKGGGEGGPDLILLQWRKREKKKGVEKNARRKYQA